MEQEKPSISWLKIINNIREYIIDAILIDIFSVKLAVFNFDEYPSRIH